MTYQRRVNESDESLIYRVCRDKEQIGTWQQVADILNPLLGTDYGESTFRKKYAAFNQMFEANRELFTDSAQELEKLREEERRLEIEKVKFRDERNAWNQQNRIQARAEAKLDNIEDALLDFGRVYFPRRKQVSVDDTNKTMIVLLSDLHVGATFDNYWGRYDSDIAENRLAQLLDNIQLIQKMHHCDECVVLSLGDQCSGRIHQTIQVTNRENVIDQVKKAAELIASFCYELTGMFGSVRMVSVAGNHSRLGDKKECLNSERLDDLISYIVKVTLSHVENFKYEEGANFDNTVAMFEAQGKHYLACHGDYDDFSQAGIHKLIGMVRVFPEAVFFGHKHFCSMSEVSGVKMIQGGSLAGSGDDFTVQYRLRGKPSQMVCVADVNGVGAFYPVELE